MKIAIWHNIGPGGAKRHLHEHVRGLLARGHALKGWCFSTADRAFLPLSELVTERVVDVRPTRVWNRLDEIAGARRRRGKALDEAAKAAAAAIDAEGFDVALLANCRMYHAPHIARYLATPSILYLHEPARFLYEAMPTLPWAAPGKDTAPWLSPKGFRARLRDLLTNRALRDQVRDERVNAAAAGHILANSRFGRESILRSYGIDCEVCYPGINTDLFAYREGEREHEVLGVGSYAWHKNIPFAIDAVAGMAEPRPRLTWIGNGGSRALAESMRRHAGERNVEMTPLFDVDDTVLVSRMQHARAMLFCPRLEPFGMAPLEAAACGLPVVAVAEGGVRETIVDGVNGLLVDPDPGAAGEALARLFADRESARALGRSGAEHVRSEWSIQQSVERLERILSAVGPNSDVSRS